MAKNVGVAHRRAGKTLKPQTFISTIEKKIKKTQKLRAVCGYVGNASNRGYIRIYLDIELRRFVDIPNKAIVHTESISDKLIPMGGVYVWFEETAAILHHGSWPMSEDPTTMATGEEGGGDPTTMATGEECSGIANPIDWIVNPFGRF